MGEAAEGLAFFDRGVPDVAGYLRLTGLPVPAHVEKAVEIYRYNRKVFIAPPWPKIFTQDRERKQDFWRGRTDIRCTGGDLFGLRL
jgi:predicted ATPase